jgi:hypothetical protein
VATTVCVMGSCPIPSECREVGVCFEGHFMADQSGPTDEELCGADGHQLVGEQYGLRRCYCGDRYEPSPRAEV